MILLSSLLIALASAQPMLSVNDDGVSFLIESSRGQFGRFASPPVVFSLIVLVLATCASAFVEDASGACVEIASCSARYALTTIDPALTEQAPQLMANQVVANNELAIVVTMGAVKGRVVTAIVLNASEPLCNYPGPNWFKGIVDGAATCGDAFVSTIPWVLAASRCGMRESMNATTVAFAGAASVQYSDVLPAIDELELAPRAVASVVQYVVEQPRSLDGLTASVNTYNNPTLLGAVTRQRYDLASGTAELTVLISLAAPLKTDGVTMSAAPSDIALAPSTAANAIDNTRCADSATTPCQQAYTFVLTPELCSLNGTFAFEFNVVCQPSVAGTPQCPTGGAVTLLSIGVTLTSEDLCALARQRLRVSGALASFESFDEAAFAPGAARTAFFQSQTQHYVLTVLSEDGFALASSALSSIVLQQLSGNATSVISLFDKAAAPTSPAAFAFGASAQAASGLTTHQHHFYFTPAPEAFGVVARNKPVASNVVASVDLAFLNGKRKRLVYALKAVAGDAVNAKFQERVDVAADEAVVESTTKTTTMINGSKASTAANTGVIDNNNDAVATTTKATTTQQRQQLVVTSAGVVEHIATTLVILAATLLL